MATKPKTTPASKPKTKKATAAPAVGKTFVGIVLDRSGSMSYGQDVTMRGFNEQLQTIQDAAKNLSSDTRVSFVVFNDGTQVLFDGVKPEEVSALNTENYRPSGSTALFDAVDDCIKLIENQPGAKEKDSAVLMLVFTDGEENASRRMTGEQLGTRIKSLEDTGRWTFTLLGPSNHVKDMAAVMNMKKGNIQGYDVNDLSARAGATATLCASTTSYFASRSVGATQVRNFYGEGAAPQADPVDVPTPSAVQPSQTPLNGILPSRLPVSPLNGILPSSAIQNTADQRTLLQNAIGSKTSVGNFFKNR